MFETAARCRREDFLYILQPALRPAPDANSQEKQPRPRPEVGDGRAVRADTFSLFQRSSSFLPSFRAFMSFQADLHLGSHSYKWSESLLLKSSGFRPVQTSLPHGNQESRNKSPGISRKRSRPYAPTPNLLLGFPQDQKSNFGGNRLVFCAKASSRSRCFRTTFVAARGPLSKPRRLRRPTSAGPRRRSSISQSLRVRTRLTTTLCPTNFLMSEQRGIRSRSLRP